MSPTYYCSNDDGQTHTRNTYIYTLHIHIHTRIHIYIIFLYIMCDCANTYAIKHALHPRGRLSEIIVLLLSLLLYHIIYYTCAICKSVQRARPSTIGFNHRPIRPVPQKILITIYIHTQTHKHT